MKLSILKKIIFSFGLALVILLVIGSSSYYYLLQLKNDILLHHSTFVEKQQLDELLSSLKDAQRGERGFLLTGEHDYLTPFNSSVEKINNLLIELSSNYQKEPYSKDSIFEIEELANKSLKIYLNIINEFNVNGLKSSLILLRIGDGNRYLEEIENKIAYINAQDSHLLNLRLSKINSSLHFIYLAIIVGFVLGVFVSGFAVYALKQDLKRRIKNESDLKEAKESAERSEKLKSEFLAQISHEIRTPINSILSFTTYLREELKETYIEDINEIFEIVHQAGNRIIRTVDLILNMSELQTGTYKPYFKKIDLYNNVIKKISTGFIRQAANKNIEFIVKQKTDNTIMLGDEYTLNQIFDNLLNNALKYTHEGKLETIVERDENNKLCVKVSDTGIGISDKFLDILFKPFSQEEQGYTREFEGNGLGLALVKKYCDLNYASISVESKKGVGTTFTVTFNN